MQTCKRLSFFVPSLGGGGAERVMVTLANGIADRGYPVDLVLADAVGPYLAEVTANVRVVNLGSRGVLGSVGGLIRYFRRVRPDAMLSAMSHANVAALLARRMSGVATRLVVSERMSLDAAEVNYKDVRNRMVRVLMRHVYAWADSISVVSSEMVEDLLRACSVSRDRVHVIYNPIVSDRLRQLAAEVPPDPWFSEEGPPIVIAAGRLSVEKDFPTLIRAFAAVRERREVRLVILGEGGERGALEKLVEQLGLVRDVSLPGFVSNPFQYMRRAAVFVLSSRWEGSPGTLIQAMACGTPVVSTDCRTGPVEILEGGRWGRLVPVGGIDALAAAIEETISGGWRPDVARRARDFDESTAVDNYLRILGCGT